MRLTLVTLPGSCRNPASYETLPVDFHISASTVALGVTMRSARFAHGYSYEYMRSAQRSQPWNPTASARGPVVRFPCSMPSRRILRGRTPRVAHPCIYSLRAHVHLSTPKGSLNDTRSAHPPTSQLHRRLLGPHTLTSLSRSIHHIRIPADGRPEAKVLVLA